MEGFKVVGVVRDAMKKIMLFAETTIEVSHVVDNSITNQTMIHGHSYWVKVYVTTYRVNPFPVEDLQKDLQRVCKTLDHQHLNLRVQCGTMEGIAEYVENEFVNHLNYTNLVQIDILRKSMGVGISYVCG